MILCSKELHGGTPHAEKRVVDVGSYMQTPIGSHPGARQMHATLDHYKGKDHAHGGLFEKVSHSDDHELIDVLDEMRCVVICGEELRGRVLPEPARRARHLPRNVGRACRVVEAATLRVHISATLRVRIFVAVRRQVRGGGTL